MPAVNHFAKYAMEFAFLNFLPNNIQSLVYLRELYSDCRACQVAAVCRMLAMLTMVRYRIR